jgi:hypothetical protein
MPINTVTPCISNADILYACKKKRSFAEMKR